MPISRYLDYLPAIYHDQAGVPADPLNSLLLAFEQILTGRGEEVDRPGLEEVLEGIRDPEGSTLLAGFQRYFSPGPGRADSERIPEEFLEWLAGWVALTLREEWDEEEKRRILSEIVASYRRRGTRQGLSQVLSAYSGLPPETITISEPQEALQVGVTSTVGESTMIGVGAPYYFVVQVMVRAADLAEVTRRKETVSAIIDTEKPAHTYYDLRLASPTIQVGVRERATVGVNTLLGIIMEIDDGLV
jgi:phage tail-like protein